MSKRLGVCVCVCVCVGRGGVKPHLKNRKNNLKSLFKQFARTTGSHVSYGSLPLAIFVEHHLVTIPAKPLIVLSNGFSGEDV